jgi:hypothetical protein
MATAIVRNERLWVTTFDEFKGDYVCKVSDGLKMAIKPSRFWEWVRVAERALQVVFGFKIFTIPYLLTLASTWNYRDVKALAMCEDRIREFFCPANVGRARSILADIRQKDKVLIGVHIRRKDYKSFLAGRYYYDDATYRREMERVLKMMCSGISNVLFIVFSDETIEKKHFETIPCYFAEGSAVEDQWMMSQCDFLMGPPSTFSAWASFMGKVPLARMWDKDYELKKEDFAYRGLVA